MNPTNVWASALLIAAASQTATALPYDAYKLLSPDSTDEARRAELGRLRDAAEGDDVQAACLLGRLGMRYREAEQLNLSHHRISKNFPRPMRNKVPELVDGNYGSTDSLLEKCALGGDIDSFLNLAVYAFRLGSYRNALVWSGVYLSLGAKLCGPTMYRRQGIHQEVIEQSREKLPAGSFSDAEVFKEVSDYLTRNAVDITAGHRSKGYFDISNTGFEINPELSRAIADEISNGKTDPRGLNTRGASASFLLELEDGGKVHQVLVIDALPNFHRASFFVERIASRYPVAQSSHGTQFVWLAAGIDENNGHAVSDPGCRYTSE